MTQAKLKVVTVLGTRPEIIRLSRVMPLLDTFTEHTIIHTGQNYDAQLNAVFYQELALRSPDHVLRPDKHSLGALLGGILCGVEPILAETRPDAFLVLGDTNSSLAAIMAKRLHITVFHMEAGNRSFDDNVPEEVNRRIVDHIADINLPYTEHARRHLLAEGLPSRRIYVTGSPLREVLTYYRSQIESSRILAHLDLRPGKFFLASMHRQENVDDPSTLTHLLTSLEALHERFHIPVIISTHPRTRRRMESLAYKPAEGLRFIEPLGFFDYNALQRHASCVLSDSGSIGEEAAILGFPAVTIRNAMERPEALETATIMITGVDPSVVVQLVATTLDQYDRGHKPECPDDYRITNCAQRVVNLILGTARLSRKWAGIDERGPFPTTELSVTRQG